jgi:hypothetical protein
MIANMKNSIRPSSGACLTSVGHIANEYIISVVDDLVTSKKRYLLLNFAVRQPSDLHQAISLHLFFSFYRKYMENKSFDLLQPCCEVCGLLENLIVNNITKRILISTQYKNET